MVERHLKKVVVGLWVVVMLLGVESWRNERWKLKFQMPVVLEMPRTILLPGENGPEPAVPRENAMVVGDTVVLIDPETGLAAVYPVPGLPLGDFSWETAGE